MIARHWRGVTRAEHASDYIAHLQHHTFASLRKLDGFAGASILHRAIENGVEFLVITRWRSLDDIRAFAGDDIETAVVPDAVQRMMIDFDRTARHYEVAAPLWPSPAAVLFVDDVVRLTSFYQHLARMNVRHHDAQYAVLEIEGLQLTIHAIRRSAGRAAAYPVREDAYVKLCLPVDSLAHARAAAANLGGEVWPPAKEWTAEDRGFRACDGRDPEGNVFQVREPLG